MKPLQNSIAVVTGASSAIGKAVAAELLKANIKVVAVGRFLKNLEDSSWELPKKLRSNYYPYKCDVTQRNNVVKAFKWIEKEFGGTDILINSEEVIRNRRIIEMKPKYLKAVLNTNIKGLVYCTQEAYKSMKEREVNGHLVHISSTLENHMNELKPRRDLNLYTATSHAVKAVNDIIRAELKSLGSGIRTTSVSPEVMASESDYKSIDKVNQLDPEDIAKAVMFAITQPPHVQINKITVKHVKEA